MCDGEVVCLKPSHVTGPTQNKAAAVGLVLMCATTMLTAQLLLSYVLTPGRLCWLCRWATSILLLTFDVDVEEKTFSKLNVTLVVDDSHMRAFTQAHQSMHCFVDS